jgi:hypothetical protein
VGAKRQRASEEHDMNSFFENEDGKHILLDYLSIDEGEK